MANLSNLDFNGEKILVKDTYAREQLAHLTVDNYTADVTGDYTANVTGDYTVNAGDIAMSSANATMHTTADRTIDTDGNDSVHIDGASTLNVGGLRTETFAGDKTEAVTGTATEKAGNRNTTVTGKWAVNLPGKTFDMKDVALQGDVTAVREDLTAVREDLTAETNRAKAAEAAIVSSIGGNALLTFGDSYDTPIDGLNGWSMALAEIIGPSHHYRYGQSGMGFVPTTNKFETELDKAISEISENDRTTVKYIVVGGGANDMTASYDDVEGTIKSFVTKAKGAFKNAQIYIAFIGNGVNTKVTSAAWVNRMTPYNIYLMENFYRRSTLNAGAFSVPAYYWANNDSFNDDFIHPNKNGKYNIAKAIYAGMTGSFFFQDGESYLKNNSLVKPYFTHKNNTVYVNMTDFNLDINEHFTGNPQTEYKFDDFVFPMLSLTMCTPSATLYCNCTLDNAYIGIVFYLVCIEGAIRARGGLVENGNFKSGTLTLVRSGGIMTANI